MKENVDRMELISEPQEFLAQTNHRHWVSARLNEGWTHGAEVDHRLKKHPYNVAYEDLPPTAKDRLLRDVRDVMKVFHRFGYQIRKTDSDPNLSSAVDRRETTDLVRLLKKTPVGLSHLRQIWMESEKNKWLTSDYLSNYSIFITIGELACKIGEPFFAYDVVEFGLRQFPNDLRLLQLQAWAMAQSGATKDAEQLLLRLPNQRVEDKDTIGLLGRCYKDFGRMAPEPAQRRAYFRQSAETYLRGFDLTGASYLGLNAATLFYLLDDTVEAMKLAGLALKACQIETDTNANDVWNYATLAELALLLDQPDTKALYKQFRAVAGMDFGVVFSARKQARLLLRKKGLPEDSLDECLIVPPVVVFAGHMIDSKTRTITRFSANLESIVREQIRKTVEALDVGIAFSSAACGSDILFAEILLELDKEYHLVLPLVPEIFRKVSVVDIGGDSWGERFDKVLSGAASVTIANPQDKFLHPTSLHFGNQLTYGMARIRAKTIGSGLKGIAVWNGKPGDCEGGTASTVEVWKSRSVAFEIIDPFPAVSGFESTSKPSSSNSFQSEIRAILFADIAGYSELDENDIQLYARYFLGGVGEIINQAPYKPLTKNTWGDALYFVFDSVHQAGLLALELQRFICEPGKWTRLGFSKDLSLRTALHVGPVYPIRDAVAERETYCGAHVNRAARIEPITLNGQIFASEQFAALVEAEGISDFTCTYVGEKTLPKASGRIRAYLLRGAD